MVKNYLISCSCILLIAHTFTAFAAENITSIVKSPEVDACIQKYGDNNSECLGSENEKSEKKLNDAYNGKLKEISNFNYSKWQMGKIDQRNDMKKSFISSQQMWLKYRDAYCHTASTGAEGIDGYGNIALSCRINMNNRRIEEIQLIHPDLSGG